MADKTLTKTPPPSIESVANGIVSQKGDPVFGNAGFGASYDFAGKDIDRYISYGSKTYGKLGYDPFRDNSNFYNQNTPASADIQRAWTGMWKLAGVGFKDTFAFGASAGDNAHKEFDETMSTYGSTRKGTSGFIANTMLSSGYTVGIMGAIAAEELLLAGATALTGGMAAPVTIGEMGGVGIRAAGLLGNAQKAVKGFDKITDALNYTKNIENARGIWASTARGSKNFIQKLAPMAETFDFIRNADNLKDLNGLQKSLQGVGALARDARKISMTNSESKLEGNLARDEFREDLINKWNADKSHVGMTMDETTLADINDRANEVFKNTYNANLALIYATNAITFDSMFKSFRGTNNLFGLHDSLKFSVSKASTGVTVNALEDTFANTLKKSISKLSWKGTAIKTLSNSVEGLQETGQDIISGATKRYSGKNPKLEGQILDSIYSSLGDATLESFASGMLMGTFASPVGKAIEGVNKFTMGGGYKAISDPLGYEQSKLATLKNAQQKAKELTEMFNTTGSYIDYASNPIFAQSLSSEKMLEAGEVGDKKSFEDQRAASFRIGLNNLIKSNMETELLDYLDDLNNHSAEELNQSLGRTDITEDNKGEFLEKASNYATKIKDFKTNHDRIEKEYINPISIQSLDSNDPEFLEKKLLHKAAEDFKQELLFSEDRIKELSTRQQELYSAITDKSFTANHVNTIVTPASVQLEIASLKKEIASNKEYNMNAPETKLKEQQLKSLIELQSSLKDYKALGTDIEDTEKVHAQMFEAFNSYRNSINGDKNTPGNRVINKKKFEQYWDYLNLKGESDVLQEHVNTMSDPLSALQHINRIKSQLKVEENNKETSIRESLEAFYTKQTSDNLIKDLLGVDVVFDHNEIDDLMERGIMPRKFFNVITHEQLKGQELQDAYNIVKIHYNQLTGKTITASNKGYATKKKSTSDKRTSSELVSQFGKELNQPISIEDFISKLLRSKYIGNTEKEILSKLVSIKGFAKKNIILTESGDTPIDVNASGDIILDVRFSSEDYKGGSISFEYLGLSALLQTYFTNQLNNNSDLKTTINSLMNDAKEAILEKEGDKLSKSAADTIPVFNNPSVFLSESLNNKAFQSLLKSIESSIDPNTKNLWESLYDSVSETLKDNFKGSLLNRAIDLAYLTISDEGIQEVLQPEVEVEVEKVITPPSVEGELSDVERVSNQITELRNTIESLNNQLNNTSKLKFKEVNNLTVKISQLNLDLIDLNQEYNDLVEKETINKNVNVNPGHESSSVSEDVMDNTGNLVISGTTKFLSLPMELQSTLAYIYLKNSPTSSTLEVLDPNVDNNGSVSPNNDFDTSFTLPVVTSNLEKISEDDIIQIEANMENNIIYIEAIANYNNSLKTSNVVVDNTELEDEEDVPVEKEYVPLTVHQMVSLFPTVMDVMSDRKLHNRVNKLNMQETVDAFSKELESLAKEIYKLGLQKPLVDELDGEDQMKLLRENWKTNQEVLKDGAFLYGKKRYRIQKVDVPFFMEQNPLVMTKTPEEFKRILFEYIQDSSNYAQSYKVNTPNVLTTDKVAIQELVNNLFTQKVAASNVIRSLNAWLSDMVSPYTIKASKSGSAGVTFTVVNKSSKINDTLSKSQKTEADLRDWYFRFDGDLFTISQAEYLVYDWLRTHKVHPSAIPVKESRSYTSNTSPYKTFDGIADSIFDVNQQEQLTRIGLDVRDLVDEILLGYRTVSSIRDYLMDTMATEKSWEVDSYGDMNSDIQDSIEMDPESMDDYDKALTDYYQSPTYLISNDGFVGDLNTLSKEERNLYDLVQTLKLGKSNQIEKKSIELNKELESQELDKNQWTWVSNISTVLKANDLTLVDSLALYRLINNPVNTITQKQRNYLNGLVLRQLGSELHIGKVVSTTDGIMRVISPNINNSINLQLLWNGAVVKMNIHDFASNTSTVLEEGTEYDPTGIDNKLDSDNVEDLSSSLNKFFDNFTGSMNEFASMKEVDLHKSITEELNKCK